MVAHLDVETVELQLTVLLPDRPRDKMAPSGAWLQTEGTRRTTTATTTTNIILHCWTLSKPGQDCLVAQQILRLMSGALRCLLIINDGECGRDGGGGEVFMFRT